MIICVCNNINEKDLTALKESGCATLKDVIGTGIEFKCCQCVPEIRNYLTELKEK